MPGIAAIIGFCEPGLRRHRLDLMLQTMQREPFYSSGSFIDERCRVGCGWVVHRGSFADHNPVVSPGDDLTLVFSGEDFADDVPLADRGDGAADGGGPGYMLRGYEAAGPGFVQQLNGSFAGLLVDGRRGEVLLFNDRFGLGRLYWSEEGGAIYVASEAKALLRVLPATRRLDPVGLAEFAACGCALQQRTLFSGIQLLPPASCWRFRHGAAPLRERYFDIATWERLPPLGAAAFDEALASTFLALLPQYLRGPAPVAMSLTGGLDGRMIMAGGRPAPGGLPCYTFGGSYRDCSDVSLARRVAHSCAQPHAVIAVGDDFIAQFPRLAEDSVYLSDGAMDVSGAVELYVNRIARDIAPVRLTGNYGSEILRGNIAFKPQPLNPRLFNAGLLRLGERAAATYDAARRCHPLSFITTRQMAWHHPSRLSLEQSLLTMRTPYLDNRLVALAYQTPTGRQASAHPALHVIARDAALARIPTDRGLLARPLPLLSGLLHWRQELSFRAEYAYDYGMPPWLARLDHRLAPLQLERLFLGRHKFYHFRIWYRDRLGETLRAVLLDSRSQARDHLAPGALPALVNAHLAGTHNHTRELHLALSIELMHRQLLDGPATP